MTKIDEMKSRLGELAGVELLEYHDKNLLSGDNKSRSEWRQETILACLEILKDLKDK